MPPTEIRPARWPDDREQVRSLFREYERGLGIDLCFQGFEQELAELPGKYAPPTGRLLIAWDGEQALGCVALRAIDRNRSEMKRLYLRDPARGTGLGFRLADAICEAARDAGYAEICLDTLPSLEAALGIYRRLGFVPTAPYVFNPAPDVIYLARML